MECSSDVFRERFGILSSVDFPAPYPKSSDCSYRIEVEEGFRLRLHFDSRFDVEDHPDVSCPYDYVKVRKHTDSCTHTHVQVLPLISCPCVRWKQEAGSSVRSVAIDHLELFRPTVTSSPSGSTRTTLEKTSAGSSTTPPKVRNKHLKEHRYRYEAPS